MLKRKIAIFFPLVLYLVINFHSKWLIQGELYSSVEELSNWKLVQLSDALQEHIRLQEKILNRMRQLQIIVQDLERNNKFVSNSTSTHDTSSELTHPVKAFVALNRFVNTIAKVHFLYDNDFDQEKPTEQNTQIQLDLKNTFDQITSKLNLPTEDDLVGCGGALLRLQAFYELDVDDIVVGKLEPEKNRLVKTSDARFNASRLMSYEDCFSLGRIAYDSGYYSVSIDWFKKTLELMQEKDDHLGDDQLSHIDIGSQDLVRKSHQDEINEILEYMAFAAYKNGQIKYSTQLTKLWLESDPNNERAKGNLEYYEEELKQEAENVPTETSENSLLKIKSSQLNLNDVYYSNAKFDPADYVVEEDEIVQYLCRLQSGKSSLNKCISSLALDKNYMISPEMRIEILNTDPHIIRLLDIISDHEAELLRKLALPKLTRSTVQSQSGLTTSEFRVAKTAWLSHETEPIVYAIESRLSTLLNLNFNDAENIQVVNYGLGGFYGPHLDSARESSISNYSSVPISNLISNDRLATILLYLNHVEAGGATVFPRLNLTVLPIKNSAVVWFNIKRNGLSDERTLHTGCPVLLGSKWIATKWPREAANSFVRPCGLKRED